MPRKEEKPIPYDFSDWEDRREVVYKCPSCTQSFKIFGRYERYCHNCGLKIKWTDMPRRCTDDQRLRLDAAERAYQSKGIDYLEYEQKKADILYEIYMTPEFSKIGNRNHPETQD